MVTISISIVHPPPYLIISRGVILGQSHRAICMTIGDWMHYAIDTALIFAVIVLSWSPGKATFADRFPQLPCIVSGSVTR
jgi:hypothetical protein